MSPIVPFCPDRLATLSPIPGVLTSRIRTFAIRLPSSPSVINVLSTIPNCPFLGILDKSKRVSLFNTLFEVNPIKMVLSFTGIFDFIIPKLSK